MVGMKGVFKGIATNLANASRNQFKSFPLSLSKKAPHLLIQYSVIWIST